MEEPKKRKKRRKRPAKKQPIPYEAMKQTLASIKDLRTRALVATQYGTGARIGELLMYKHKDEVVSYGLLRSNIIKHEGYYDFLIPSFKDRPIELKHCIIVHSERFIIDPIEEWLESTKNDQVFGFRQSRARQLIKEAVGFSSHYLRHSRAQHLVDEFKFNIFEVKDALGHRCLETSLAYVMASPTNMVEKISKRLKER